MTEGVVLVTQIGVRRSLWGKQRGQQHPAHGLSAAKAWRAAGGSSLPWGRRRPAPQGRWSRPWQPACQSGRAPAAAAAHRRPRSGLRRGRAGGWFKVGGISGPQTRIQRSIEIHVRNSANGPARDTADKHGRSNARHQMSMAASLRSTERAWLPRYTPPGCRLTRIGGAVPEVRGNVEHLRVGARHCKMIQQPGGGYQEKATRRTSGQPQRHPQPASKW